MENAALESARLGRLHALDAENDRVRRNTASHVQGRIDSQIRAHLLFYASAPREAIAGRLTQLDAEWPIDRALMAGVSVNVLFGLLMGRFLHRAWLLQPAVVALFLMQHILQGWCPPLAILRRLGFRTAKEIAFERNALKALRGDYESLKAATDDVGGKLDKALLAAA